MFGDKDFAKDIQTDCAGHGFIAAGWKKSCVRCRCVPFLSLRSLMVVLILQFDYANETNQVCEEILKVESSKRILENKDMSAAGQSHHLDPLLEMRRHLLPFGPQCRPSARSQWPLTSSTAQSGMSGCGANLDDCENGSHMVPATHPPSSDGTENVPQMRSKESADSC